MCFESDQTWAFAVRMADLSRQNAGPTGRIDRDRRAEVVMTAFDLHAHANNSVTSHHWFRNARAFMNDNAIVLGTSQQDLVHHRATKAQRGTPTTKPFARDCNVVSLARVENSFIK